MIPKQVARQRDFSAGQIDASAMRRDDQAAMRAGCRQASNKRLLSTGATEQRPGRRALFSGHQRVEEIRVGGTLYRLCFAAASLSIRSTDSTILLTVTGRPWTSSTIKSIVPVPLDYNVVLFYPNMRPLVLTLDPDDGTWSSANFAFDISAVGQKRCPFYRLSPKGISMLPSAVSGTIDIQFSDDVLVADHVGTRMRYQGRQMTIASVIDPQNGTANVNERLFTSQRLVLTSEPLATFTAGDLVDGDTSGAKGVVVNVSTVVSQIDPTSFSAIGFINGAGIDYADGDIVELVGGVADERARLVVHTDGSGHIDSITSVDRAGSYIQVPTNPVSLAPITGAGSGGSINPTWIDQTNTLDVALRSGQEFIVGEDVAGPTGIGTTSSVTDIDPVAVDEWDEEVFNDLQGWPASGFLDQRRLGFCDIPAIKGGISWSAIDAPNDHYPDANPSNAIFEIVPSKDRVLHLVPGDDEFVFTEKGVYYIPISETNPLKPGSVAFRQIVAEASSSVHPVVSPQGVLYVSEGLSQLIAIVSTGQVAKPYLARDVSELHTELFTSPIALAFASGGDQYPEQYLYILNDDGSLIVGRYDAARQWPGYVPWSSGYGKIVWVSARQSTVLMTVRYTPNDTLQVTEELDADAWLDAQFSLNDAPDALAPGPGLGTLWMWAGGTVELMNDRRYLGTRSVDASGNLILQEGDDFSSDDIVVGQKWTETLQPFIPHMQEGRSSKQTMRRRKLGKIGVTVQNSVGFSCAGRRIPPYVAGSDEGRNPTLREHTYFFKQQGRDVDPVVEIVKDVPGPLRIVEFSVEAGI